MVKKILLSIAAICLVVGVVGILAGVSSLSIFTSQAVNDSNTFDTGTVGITTDPSSAFITLSDMAPGDVVTASLTVENGGTLAQRYAATSTTDEDTLAAQLDLEIKSDVSTCTTAGFDADGTTLYGPADLGSVAGIDVIGDPTTGPDTGDRYLSSTTDVVDADGTYPEGAGADAPVSEDLCFQVTLPLSTDNDYQDLTTTATFTFNAEQRRNNP